MNGLLVPLAPTADADNVTPVPAWYIVTVPVHCPFEKLTEAGLIVPGPVVADTEVEPVYPVTVFPNWSLAVMVIWKPVLLLCGLEMLLKANRLGRVGFTVIEPLVADWIEFVTVTVRVPAVLKENPLKVCIP